jgi:hypothetical protein
MTSTIIKKTMTVVFAVCLIIAFVPRAALGEPGYTIVGDDNGLEIYIPSKTVDTGNLNPGDKMYSCLKLINTGSHQLNVYIRTNIKSERSPNGGRLSEVMALIIKDGDNVISDSSFKAAAKKGNIYIGKMAPGTEKTICFFTNLPEETDNKYQAASMKVNWTFTTQADGGGGDDHDDKPPKRPPKDDDDYDTPPTPPIEDEPIPLGPGETEVPSEPEIIIIEDEDIPTGPADMPTTGETSPFCYYGTGALAVMLGMAIRKDKDWAGK